MTFSIICLADARLPAAKRCAESCGLSVSADVTNDDAYAVIFGPDNVCLRSNHSKQGDVLVDFCGGSAAHRRKFGGGKGQLIAKAVGLNSGVRPHVYDMTAGLGGDAFVLASLGCAVTLFERNPVVYALLEDGLLRARQFAQEQDPELLEIMNRMELHSGNGTAWLREAKEKLPVIYLDPMFPERRKAASVKKEMQVFHELVGDDADASELLEAALQAAEHRVVVKRPRIAPSIDGRAVSYALQGKSSRFDIYALKSLSTG